MKASLRDSWSGEAHVSLHVHHAGNEEKPSESDAPESCSELTGG